MPNVFHLKAPIWWNGSTSTHSTFFIGATKRATFSMLSGASVSPGTRTKRTQTGFPIALRRSAKRKVGSRSLPGQLSVGVGVAALDVQDHHVEVGEVCVVGARSQEA